MALDKIKPADFLDEFHQARSTLMYMPFIFMRTFFRLLCQSQDVEIK